MLVQGWTDRLPFTQLFSAHLLISCIKLLVHCETAEASIMRKMKMNILMHAQVEEEKQQLKS